MSAKYLIWSNEQTAWWRPERAGYTTQLAGAGRYSRAVAIELCATCRDGWSAHITPTEIPVREADALACEKRDQSRRENLKAPPS